MSQEEKVGWYAQTQGTVDTGGCSQLSGVYQGEPLQSQVRGSRDRRWQDTSVTFHLEAGPSRVVPAQDRDV